ncbi:MAG: HAD family hydrolase [Bdellovibrionota bacterium]
MNQARQRVGLPIVLSIYMLQEAMADLKYLFFDFGGCIDAPGIHTRVLFWDAFLALNLRPRETREEFQEAYTKADAKMMASGEAKDLGLKAFNRHNSRLIAATVGVEESAADKAGDLVTEKMSEYIWQSRKALLAFAETHPMGLISNFTGNLEVILKEFDLRGLFDSVTESFYAGYSKPDPRIFRAALTKQPFVSAECLYVGDNPKNDIEPARALGLRTALIHPSGQKRECEADYYLEALEDLLPLTQSK